MDTLELQKIIATRQNSAAGSAAPPASLDYGELAVDIDGVLRTGNKNNKVVTHVVSTDERLTDTRNPRVTVLTNQDLNTITTPGFYYAGGGNTVTNKPSGIAAFGLLVEQTASGYRSQLLIGGDSLPNKMFIRQYTSTAWGAWSSFYTTAYKPSLSELGAAAASHTHTKSQITDFPTSLKNPTSIKIQLNNGTSEGTNQFTYDGSTAKNINITPSSIGAAASSHTHSYLPLSGGTMTGAITLPGNPTSNLHAATKQYVDSKIAGSGSGDMLKSVYDTDNDGIVDVAKNSENSRYADYAQQLNKSKTINGTSFDGSANITTLNWGTARNITIGNTKKSVNGSSDITWSLGEIGAATVDSSSSFSGAARAATQLATTRTFTIGDSSKSFNGTANVSWSYSDLKAMKTYTTISQLGYSSATTISNLYKAMSNNSQAILQSSDVTNPPQQGSTIYIVKKNAQYGYAEAYSREDGTKYIMISDGTSLAGNWVLLANANSVVQSVNGKTGTSITLSAADVKARPDSWMPTAAQVGALAISATQIDSFTSPTQIPAQSLAFIHFDSASAINANVEDGATFTDYATGDMYGLWMGQSSRAYGTLFIASARFNGYFWNAQVWNYKFVRFKKQAG